MKKIILIVMTLGVMQITAQEQKRDRQEKTHRFKDFTLEEAAKIQTKEMTLQLDLTNTQQKEVQKLNLKNAKDRNAKREASKLKKEKRKGEKFSKEERIKMMNGRLDKQISNKKEMKRILSKEQFEKFESNQNLKLNKLKACKQKNKSLKKQGSNRF